MDEQYAQALAELREGTIDECAEQGDFAAVDVLADLTTAVTRAGLTARQWEAVENVYLRDMTQEDAGRAMGVSRQSMYEYLERAEEKISEIYYYWAGHGEGYSISGGDAV